MTTGHNLSGAHSEDHEGVVCYITVSIYVQWNSNVAAWLEKLENFFQLWAPDIDMTRMFLDPLWLSRPL